MSDSSLDELEKLRRKFIQELCDLEMKSIETNDMSAFRQCQVIRRLLSETKE